MVAVASAVHKRSTPRVDGGVRGDARYAAVGRLDADGVAADVGLS